MGPRDFEGIDNCLKLADKLLEGKRSMSNTQGCVLLAEGLRAAALEGATLDVVLEFLHALDSFCCLKEDVFPAPVVKHFLKHAYRLSIRTMVRTETESRILHGVSPAEKSASMQPQASNPCPFEKLFH